GQMDIKGFASSKTEITLPNQDQQNLEKPLDSQTGILAQTDVIENASQSSYFSGELLKTPDFVEEQKYLLDYSNPSAANSDALTAIKDNLNQMTDDAQEIQFQIQTATSDLQNAESMTASLEKKLNDERAQLAKNLGGGGGSVQQLPFESAISENFRIGDFFQLTVDAIHGQPRNYDDLQKVVQDLKNLLNGLQIPN